MQMLMKNSLIVELCLSMENSLNHRSSKVSVRFVAVNLAFGVCDLPFDGSQRCN